MSCVEITHQTNTILDLDKRRTNGTDREKSVHHR